MNQGWLREAFDNITPRAILFAVIAGLLCALLQFFIQVQIARTAMADDINELVKTLEKPAARAVLILDSELAHDIATGLTEHDYILAAQIFEDHNVVLGEARRSHSPPYSRLEGLMALLVGTEASLASPLHLPESMSEATGEIKITFDRARGVTAILYRARMTLFVSFLISALIVLMIVALDFRRHDTE